MAFVRRADILGTLTVQKRHAAKQLATATQPPPSPRAPQSAQPAEGWSSLGDLFQRLRDDQGLRSHLPSDEDIDPREFGRN